MVRLNVAGQRTTSRRPSMGSKAASLASSHHHHCRCSVNTLDATPASTRIKLYPHHVQTLSKISVGHILILAEDDTSFLNALHLYFDDPLKKYLQKEPRNNLSHVRTFVGQQLEATPHPSSLFEPTIPTQPLPASSA